jgi:hypothetical protein
MDKEDSCTCPPPEKFDNQEFGVSIKMPGVRHRRGCPVVEYIFRAQDQAAQRVAERFARGGILRTPGEQALSEIRALETRVERVELENQVLKLELELERLVAKEKETDND